MDLTAIVQLICLDGGNEWGFQVDEAGRNARRDDIGTSPARRQSMSRPSCEDRSAFPALYTDVEAIYITLYAETTSLVSISLTTVCTLCRMHGDAAPSCCLLPIQSEIP